MTSNAQEARKENPDRKGPAISGNWTELSPNGLYMTSHIGELTVGEGRKWTVAQSLNGLGIFVTTDLSYARTVKPKHGGVSDDRRFLLDTMPLIRQLAGSLLFPDEGGLTPEQAWQELCETPDITSPEEYPDHALITMEQLADFMRRAASPSTSGCADE